MPLNKTVLWVIGALALMVPFCQAGQQLKVGTPFPDIAKFQLEGAVPEIKGKVVVIDFWASWCNPCRESFPAMEELRQRFAKQGVVFLAVNVDEKKGAMEEFLRKNPVGFPILRDTERKLVEAVSISSMPTSFVVDREGTVRFVHNGFHGSATKDRYVQEIEELLRIQISRAP